MSYADLKAELKIDLSLDPWGHAMGAWFDAASELWWRGVWIPPHWQYNPGAATDPRDPDSSFFEAVENVDSEELLLFGELLCRYTRYLDHKGCSY